MQAADRRALEWPSFKRGVDPAGWDEDAAREQVAQLLLRAGRVLLVGEPDEDVIVLRDDCVCELVSEGEPVASATGGAVQDESSADEPVDAVRVNSTSVDGCGQVLGGQEFFTHGQPHDAFFGESDELSPQGRFLQSGPEVGEVAVRACEVVGGVLDLDVQREAGNTCGEGRVREQVSDVTPAFDGVYRGHRKAVQTRGGLAGRP